ncbi:MAG: phosphate ABC transporter substrate-binding protein [Methanoregulaceae archaeon]|nr:phosphate ABC transporter substrate-binding protein [Methanoregulaceae archaeon]
MLTTLIAATMLTGQSGSVTIKGSDTLLILNQRWAEAYGKSNSNVSISVTGGGSSIGIRAFINRVAEICASSRKMKASEIASARSNRAIANEIPVALDGLAILVHESNPVKSLTMDELRRIYIGQIKNWSELGGPNASITVFSRDSNSGTYGFFQEKVLRNQNWGSQVRFMPSTSEEVREVARTPNGIAYGGVAYFANKKNTKMLPIAPTKGAEPVPPSEEMVRSKKYPIWRYLYYYTNGKPSGATKSFIDFCLSAEGQRIVEQVGYYSVK